MSTRRKPRVIIPGSKYHVVARINRSEMLFKKDNLYKKLFLQYVVKAKKKYNFEVDNLCVMGNHIHMIIKPLADSRLSDIMKSILGGFARKYNQMNGIKGHVWYDRFKSKVISTMEQFIRTFQYISNNPVRAGIVGHPLHYEHSAVFALYSNEETCIKELLYTIINYTKNIKSYFDEYIKLFDINKAVDIDKEVGFYDIKPGRPKKVRS